MRTYHQREVTRPTSTDRERRRLTYDRVLVNREADLDRPGRPMRFEIRRYWKSCRDLWRRRREVLALLEVRQEIRPAPTGIAQLLPRIEIWRRPPIPKHAIDHGPASDNRSRVNYAGLVIESGLRYAVIVSEVLCGWGDARYEDPWIAVVAMDR